VLNEVLERYANTRGRSWAGVGGGGWGGGVGDGVTKGGSWQVGWGGALRGEGGVGGLGGGGGGGGRSHHVYSFTAHLYGFYTRSEVSKEPRNP